MYIPADKTYNYYKLKPDKYNQMLMKNINKDYRKDCNSSNIADINEKSKQIAVRLGIEDRVYTYPNKTCFGNIKDHKQNFACNPSLRLLNPATNQLGSISKRIVEKICNQLREKLQVTQWKSTKSVINWFKKIPNKKNKKFVKLDRKVFIHQ